MKINSITIYETNSEITDDIEIAVIKKLIEKMDFIPRSLDCLRLMQELDIDWLYEDAEELTLDLNSHVSLSKCKFLKTLNFKLNKYESIQQLLSILSRSVPKYQNLKLSLDITQENENDDFEIFSSLNK